MSALTGEDMQPIRRDLTDDEKRRIIEILVRGNEEDDE
ncbi:hypothetical protein DFR75_112134 [Nocardia ignorata]|uniref:Uncharacterized protein n=1 Tax=Nocardia ignorata TaxID=145285 RepID=A0A4R6P0F4_NOCIG|nr:hypothetical protein DFR75_112134 [Nocardia ignorata]